MSYATPSFSSAAAMPFDEGRLGFRRKAVSRWVDNLQTDRGVGAQHRIARQKIDPWAFSPPNRRWFLALRRRALAGPSIRRPTSPSRVRRDSPPRTSIDGVLMVSPWKMPSLSLPPLVMRKIFGNGHAANSFRAARSARRRENEHAVRGLAAERLLPGERRDIELWPVERLREGRPRSHRRSTSGPIGGDPVGIGHAHTRGGAVPGEDDVACRIDAGEIGSSP